MNKLLLRLTTLLLALLLATGCAVTDTTPASSVPEKPAAPSPASSAAPAWPRTLTDQLGRTVTLEQRPERLVSGYYITSSLLIALEADERMVGIEAKAKSRPIYGLTAPALLELPSVGSAKDFDLEGCLALEPDLVILPVRLKDSIETLESMGVTVLAVDPEDDARLRETIELVATAIDADARGQALLADLDRRAEALLTQTALHSTLTTVYFAGNSAALSTAGQGMYQHALIGKAGGLNVAGELTGKSWSTVSYEQLLAWNPDVIVLAPGADYDWAEVAGEPALAGLTAKVVAMPSAVEAWDSPVPSSILGAEWLAAALYGGEAELEQFRQSAVAFYRDWYGVELAPALMAP